MPGSIFYEPMIRVVIVTHFESHQHTLWFGFQLALKTPIELQKS